MHGRNQHIEEVTAVVTKWTGSLTKEEIEAQGRKYRIPLSPVRDVSEVMHDQAHA